jgi:two-component system chemotaxis response regulator CheY
VGKIRVLVVEDDFLSRNFLGKIASAYGQVEVAVDGLEAVEAVKRSYEAKDPYAVIFLDIMMPELDGQAALKQIRAYEEELGVLASDTCKVIMTTALGDAKNVMSAFDSSCDAYITKPYSPKIVQEQIEKLFPELKRETTGGSDARP